MANFSYLTTALYQSGSTPNPIIAEIPFTKVTFDIQLNSIGTFSGEVLLSGLDPMVRNAVLQGTAPAQTCLYVDYGGELIWGGVIWQRSYDSSTQILTITGNEMLSYFQRRKITPLNTTKYNSGGSQPTSIVYTNVDICTVANDLMVNYSQSVNYPVKVSGTWTPQTITGNIGLIGSTATSGLAVTRTYYDFELKEIYQAVKDLSDGLDNSTPDGAGYFDFWIVPSYNSSKQIIKTLKLAPYVTGGAYTSVFQFPGNLVEYTYPEDGTTAANALFGLGYGSNANKTIAVALDNSVDFGGSIAVGTGTAAILEDSASFIDIQDTGLLQASSLGHLNAVSQPPVTVQVVLPPYVDPLLGTYNVGDFARLIINDDRFPSGYDYAGWRIAAISVEPGEDGASRVTVTLSRSVWNYGTVSIVTQ